MGHQADFRAAVVDLLTDFAANASIQLQVYQARPASIHPPTAFIDAMGDDLTDFSGNLFQHVPVVEIVVLHGAFDSGEAVAQRDAFVDAFHEWQRVLPHAAGSRTLGWYASAWNSSPGCAPRSAARCWSILAVISPEPPWSRRARMCCRQRAPPSRET